jgi:hypothetical protein
MLRNLTHACVLGCLDNIPECDKHINSQIMKPGLLKFSGMVEDISSELPVQSRRLDPQENEQHTSFNQAFPK